MKCNRASSDQIERNVNITRIIKFKYYSQTSRQKNSKQQIIELMLTRYLKFEPGQMITGRGNNKLLL